MIEPIQQLDDRVAIVTGASSAFRSVIALNVEALFAVSSLVGRSMRDRGSGSIVNISSIL